MKLNRPLQGQVNGKGWRSEDRRYKFKCKWSTALRSWQAGAQQAAPLPSCETLQKCHSGEWRFQERRISTELDGF
jgi:hypothetical protein